MVKDSLTTDERRSIRIINFRARHKFLFPYVLIRG
jgi:hypothetical protein